MSEAISERYVVIMAGGSGTRFWPASRRAHPKQFLSIGGDRSLLRQTAERVSGLVGWDHIIVVTAKVHADHAKVELPELDDEQILIEPEGRNTAPCIGWATRTIAEESPEATIAVLPADHYIADADDFCAHLSAAMDAADQNIVLLGLVPTRPETGYGYIKQGELQREVDGRAVMKVDAFKEKPDASTAEQYLADGGYLWNSGMFIYKAPVMLAAIEKHMPELAEGLAKLTKAKKIRDTYPTLPSVSIDYGVMEKEREALLVLPSNFAWSDVGSWDAAHEVFLRDDNGNVVLGDAILDNVHNSLIDARSGRLVAVVDMEDVVVVDTTDAVLIVPRAKSQAVKRIVERLKADEREQLL